MTIFHAIFASAFLLVSYLGPFPACCLRVQAADVVLTKRTVNSKTFSLLKKAYFEMLNGEYLVSKSTQKQAFKGEKNSLFVLQYSGYALLEAGAYDESLKELHHLLFVNKPSSADMTLFGQACLKSGYLPLAEQWFRECLVDSPRNLSAIIGLKCTALALKRKAEKGKEAVARAELDGGSVKKVEIVSLSSGTALNSISSGDSNRVSNSVLQETLKTRSFGNNEIRNAWENHRGIQVIKR
jgi:tetratricopeptide (TPR) repeat protein